MPMSGYKALVVAVLTTLIVLAGCQAGGSVSTAGGGAHTPVVLFPAFLLPKLQITVHDQVVAPECPRSGGFEDWFRNDHPSTTFSQICQDKLLTLRYNAAPSTTMPRRFSNQQGVTVQVKDYGRTESVPFYADLQSARIHRLRTESGYPRRRLRLAAHPRHGQLPAAHGEAHRGHLPG